MKFLMRFLKCRKGVHRFMQPIVSNQYRPKCLYCEKPLENWKRPNHDYRGNPISRSFAVGEAT